MLDWTGIRDFLAVAEAGSLSAAATTLGMSQPTIGRRVAALEKQVGDKLFARTPRGITLTDTGERLLVHAREMEQAAFDAERKIAGSQRRLEGPVRISTTETLGITWLTPRLAEFRTQYPGIVVDLFIDNHATNLLKREADIAVRLVRPGQADLIAKSLGEMVFGLYASPAYLEAYGIPETVADLAHHKAVAYDQTDEGLMTNWLKETGMERSIAHRSNSLLGVRAAAQAGFGITAYACAFADSDPDLVRILPAYDANRSPMWSVTHPDLRYSPRMRAVLDFLRDLFNREADAFRGKKADENR